MDTLKGVGVNIYASQRTYLHYGVYYWNVHTSGACGQVVYSHSERGKEKAEVLAVTVTDKQNSGNNFSSILNTHCMRNFHFSKHDFYVL